MTIIAGFQCTDGILICSDTEVSFGSGSDLKYQTGKVPIVQLMDFTMAIGGAGDGALIEFVVQDLVKYLVAKKYDWDTVEDGLNEYASKIFRRHIRSYAGLPVVPEISFLIALSMGGLGRLFKWERNFVYAVPPKQHTSIGIGTAQSEQLLNEIQFYYPAEQMVFFAVRMMQQVKQFVQGCGGKTEVVFLDTKKDAVLRHGIFVVDDIEHITLMTDEFIADHVLSFIANTGDTSKEMDDLSLENVRKVILSLREKYQRIMPGMIFKEIKPSSS